MQPTTTIYGAHDDIAPGSSMSGTYNAPTYNNSYTPPVTPGNPSAGVSSYNTPPQQQDNATYLQNLYNSNPTAIKKAMNDPYSKKYYSGESLSPSQWKEYDAKKALEDQQTRDADEAKRVSQTINDIRMGVMPLSAGEQAQVSALEQSFGQLINQQQLRNKASEGTGNIRGYQTGAAEYDPTFQAKTIGTLVSAGLGQISNLNIQMAGAVAKLKQSFQEDDLEAVREAWDIYETTSAKRAETLQKTINDAQAEIVAAQEAQVAQEKAYYEQVTKPVNEIAREAAQSGATPEQLAMISNSSSVTEALMAAGSSLTKYLPGILGEYQFYAKQAEAAGQVPVSFNAYQDIDANRKKSIARAGASGASGGAGGAAGVTSGGKYASDLDALVGATLATIGSKFGQEQFAAQMKLARNDADKINLIAATVLKTQPSELKLDFANQAVGIKEIDKAIKLIDSGVQTGVLQNGLQYTFNLFGKDYDPNLARISSYLTGAIQPYRNSVTGAAWGDQEDGEYASLFGSTKFSPTELRQRLETVKELLKSKSAQGLNTFVNPMGTYGNVFETGNLSTSQAIIQNSSDNPLHLDSNTSSTPPPNDPLGII